MVRMPQTISATEANTVPVYHASHFRRAGKGEGAHVHIRFSSGEAAEIERRTAAVGQSRSRIVRYAVLGRHQMDDADPRILCLGSNPLANRRLAHIAKARFSPCLTHPEEDGFPLFRANDVKRRQASERREHQCPHSTN